MDDFESSNTDALLVKLGGCGLFQVILTLIINFMCIPAYFGFLVDTFGLYNPGWRCLDNDTVTYLSISDNVSAVSRTTVWNVTRLNTTLLLSTQNSSQPDLSKYGKHSCDYYQSCNKVEFNPAANTYVTEWGLVCNKRWVPSTILSIRMAGNMFSTLMVGYIGDKYGRKYPLIFAVIMQFLVLNFIAAFSVSWQMYAVIAFCMGCLGPFSVLAGCIGFEYVPPAWRVKLNSIPSWSLISILFAVTAMLAHDWKNLRIITLVIGVVAILPVFWAPKSLRWLSVKGKKKEFKEVVKRIARINKTTIPERYGGQDGMSYSLLGNSDDEMEVLEVNEEEGRKKKSEGGHAIHGKDVEHETEMEDVLQQFGLRDEQAKSDEQFNVTEMKNEETQTVATNGGRVANKSYTVFSLFRRKSFRTSTLVIGFVSLTIDLLYYALSLGVISLPGNLYINMIISSATELPANVISFFIANRFRRRPSTFVMFLMVCFCLFGIVAINLSPTTADVQQIGFVALVMAAKLFLIIGYVIFSTSIGEIYPTVVRATVNSYIWFTSSIGDIASPFLIPYEPNTFYISFLAMAILFLVSSSLVLCLPETKGKTMLDDWPEDSCTDGKNTGDNYVDDDVDNYIGSHFDDNDDDGFGWKDDSERLINV